MPYLKVKDGTHIFYKDGGTGQPIVFSHGWPLDADAWDIQMLFFGQQGYRVLAHDRRSHGRSDQTWDGNNMDTYADDLAELFNSLDLHNAVMIGHSTGGGEVVRYLARHGTSRVAKGVLVSAVPPVMVKKDSNPGGLPIEVFDGLRAQQAANRSQFFEDLSLPFYNYNRPGAVISQGIRDDFWRQGMLGGNKGEYDCIKAFSETDFTEEMKKLNIPFLVLHGEDDQIVPYKDAGVLSAKLLPDAKLKTYPGFPHGMLQTHADTLNPDLLAFIKS
jgi:non-heme chloroperoxidase